jgi:hypothetical protein
MRRFTSRRGLGTVVTTAIMLTAVAVLGSFVVSWSNGNLRTFETGLSITSSSNTNKINEFLTIENVWFCTTTCPTTGGKAVNVTLTNSGNLALNVTDIKLVNTTKTFDTVIKNVSIKQGKSYSWQTKYAWGSKVPVTISVTTARGSIFTTQVSSP